MYLLYTKNSIFFRFWGKILFNISKHLYDSFAQSIFFLKLLHSAFKISDLISVRVMPELKLLIVNWLRPNSFLRSKFNFFERDNMTRPNLPQMEKTSLEKIVFSFYLCCWINVWIPSTYAKSNYDSKIVSESDQSESCRGFEL